MRTLQEIENCPKTMLVPADVAEFLGCDPYSINRAAKDAPGLLGFPIIVMGTRVRIPKDGFVRFCRGLQDEETEAAG